MDNDNKAQETRACAIIAAKGTAQAIGQVGTARNAGIALVELRMDLIFGNCIPDFGLIKKAHENWLKCIVTFRDKKEGGAFQGEGKKELVVRAIESGADFVDIETSHSDIIKAIAPKARAAGCRIIGSWHDFGSKPEISKMVEAIRTSKNLSADIAKVAFVVSDEKEGRNIIAELAKAAKLAGIPAVISPMGADAAKNRAYALAMGSEFAYCTVDGSEGIKGVPTFKELSESIKG